MQQPWTGVLRQPREHSARGHPLQVSELLLPLVASRMGVPGVGHGQRYMSWICRRQGLASSWCLAPVACNMVYRGTAWFCDGSVNITPGSTSHMKQLV